MLRALLIALGLSSTACSLVVVRGPPPDAARRPYLACTASPTAPIIDSVVTAAMVAALASVAGGQQDGAYPTNYAGALVSTGIGILGFGGSAAYGYVETARCRDAYAELQERLNSPPRWVPPPPPRFIPPPPGVAPQPGYGLPPGGQPAGVSAPVVQPPRDAPAAAPPMVAPPAPVPPPVPKTSPAAGESQALPFDSDEEPPKRGGTKHEQKKSDDDEDESDDEDSAK